MSEVKYVEFLNFLNFGEGGDDDEKQLVGLRQASGRRQKSTEDVLHSKCETEIGIQLQCTYFQLLQSKWKLMVL